MRHFRRSVDGEIGRPGNADRMDRTAKPKQQAQTASPNDKKEELRI
jgi:hypothetical protein